LGHGEFVAQQKILQRMLVEDVADMERIFAADIEIEPMFAAAQAIKRLAGAMKATEWFARFFKLGRAQQADGLDGAQLRQGIEPVELAHRLFGKRNLIHAEKSMSSIGRTPRRLLPGSLRASTLKPLRANRAAGVSAGLRAH